VQIARVILGVLLLANAVRWWRVSMRPGGDRTRSGRKRYPRPVAIASAILGGYLLLLAVIIVA
jgi:hypothetical protein